MWKSKIKLFIPEVVVDLGCYADFFWESLYNVKCPIKKKKNNNLFLMKY